jgi:hypothetical protein
VTYLVDANVLSEPTRPQPDPLVIEWLRAHERDIVVDPIILGELRFGILLCRMAGSGRGSSNGSTPELGTSTVCHGTRVPVWSGRPFWLAFA